MVKLIKVSICRHNSGPKEYKYDKFNGLSVGIVVNGRTSVRKNGREKKEMYWTVA